MLQMVEKGIRGGIYHVIHQRAKADNKYMEDYKKGKESLCLMYWDANSLYGWAMSEKLPADNLEFEENALNFDEKFIKSYDQNINEGYFEVNFEYHEQLTYNDLSLLSETMEVCMIKKSMLYT